LTAVHPHIIFPAAAPESGNQVKRSENNMRRVSRVRASAVVAKKAFLIMMALVENRMAPLKEMRNPFSNLFFLSLAVHCIVQNRLRKEIP